MPEQDSKRRAESLAGKLPLTASLSGRLLLLTIAFVMLAEILIYVPSIANFRVGWFEERLAAAQIASLALEATMSDEITPELEEELLNNAGVLQVVLHRDQTRMLMLAKQALPMIDASYDLRDASAIELIYDAFVTLGRGGNRTIMVKGMPEHGGGVLIEVTISEDMLHSAMLTYSRNILTLSIIISLLSAVLIFLSLRNILVKPMRNITESMVKFREKPEDADRIIRPHSHVQEMRIAEEELAAMQTELRNSLQQKTHLAALGLAVSKINHDLRNILASAQLLSDRLSLSDDPKVQSVAPKLVSSIDRAVDLTTNTLKYGKAEEPPPRKTDINLADLVNDVGTHMGLPESGRIEWSNRVPPDLKVKADTDQLFRVLLNLGRNAAQAIESRDSADGIDKIEVAAHRETIDGRARLHIKVSDTGPGIPDAAKQHLFEAFTSSRRQGGTGLGLAIAKELTEAHGGTIELLSSDQDGTVFRITLPDGNGEA